MKTFNVEVKKTLKLTEEDLDDILCSCFEGGCSYWCCIDNTAPDWKRSKGELYQNGNDYPTIEEIMLQMLKTDKPIRLIDQEEDVSVYLTMESFLKGIAMSVENGFWSGEEIMDVDGIVGDAIIQYAVFGEQVYG